VKMTKTRVIRELEQLEKRLGDLANTILREGITDGPEPFPGGKNVE